MALAENISVLKPRQTPSHAYRPTVKAARLRARHIVILISFVVLVALPVTISAWYLWTRAADQFASTLAFSIRSEEPSSGIELLGGIADISGSGASDSDILFDYLNSQQIVAQIQAETDLAFLWSKPVSDPIFAFQDTSFIEDLHSHWERMVEISLDSTRGIIQVRAKAFTAQDAQKISAEILAKSEDLINQINNIAHEDSVRYALGDLQRTKNSLSNARSALTEFRILNEIVDPSIDVSSQTEILGSLDAQLTETLIEIDILSENTRRSDTRLNQAETRRRVLQARIEQERRKRVFGMGELGQKNTAQLFGDYERLLVDVEFAEQSYQASRASFEVSVSEARRNTRYLAAHIMPSIAEQSLFPRRGLTLSLIALCSFLIWALFVLMGLSFLDRR